MLQDPLPQERSHLVEEDNVHAAAGGEVRKAGGEARLEAPPVDVGTFAHEDGHVEIAVAARPAAGAGAEDGCGDDVAMLGDDRSDRFRNQRSIARPLIPRRHGSDLSSDLSPSQQDSIVGGGDVLCSGVHRGGSR